MTTVTVSYVDTCFADSLDDHHNREGEMLVGVLAGDYARDDRGLAMSIVALATGDDIIPEDIPDTAIYKAAHACVKSVNWRWGNLDPAATPDDVPCAWFLIRW